MPEVMSKAVRICAHGGRDAGGVSLLLRAASRVHGIPAFHLSQARAEAGEPTNSIAKPPSPISGGRSGGVGGGQTARLQFGQRTERANQRSMHAAW